MGQRPSQVWETQLGLSFYLLIDSPVFFQETCSHFLWRISLKIPIRVQNLGWKEGAWKSRKSAISFYYHLQMRVGESEMLIMALILKKQYEIKSSNADCMTLFSEHLPSICKEKGASAAFEALLRKRPAPEKVFSFGSFFGAFSVHHWVPKWAEH